MADRAGLANTIASYGDELRAFFARRGFCGEEATELSAATLTAALNGLDRFRAESSPRTWLYRIARNLMANALRGRKVLELSIEELEEELPGNRPAEDPLHLLLIKEESARLEAAIVKLSPRRRQCLHLAVVEHHSAEEIAAILNVTPATVRVTLHQTRNLLEKMTKN